MKKNEQTCPPKHGSCPYMFRYVKGGEHVKCEKCGKEWTQTEITY